FCTMLVISSATVAKRAPTISTHSTSRTDQRETTLKQAETKDLLPKRRQSSS
ncbi:hypothetical protein STEG23_017899, partial [Scotinomys teguina]